LPRKRPLRPALEVVIVTSLGEASGWGEVLELYRPKPSRLPPLVNKNVIPVRKTEQPERFPGRGEEMVAKARTVKARNAKRSALNGAVSV